MSVRKFFGVAVSLACLLVLVWLVSPERVVACFAAASPVSVMYAACLTPIVLLTRALRWHILARAEVPNLSFRDTWRSYMAGLVLAVVTPLAAGELGRAAFVKGGSLLRLSALVALDKALDLTLVLGLSIAGLGVVFPWARTLWPLALVLPLGWVGAPTCLRRLPSSLLLRLPSQVRQGLDACARPTTSEIVAVAVLACGTFASYYLQALLMLRAFAPGAGLTALALWPSVTISTIVPAFLGGLGVRELTAAWLLPAAGIDSAAAVNAAFLQFVIVMVVPAILATPLLQSLPLRRAH